MTHITHTEILVLAISAIDTKLKEIDEGFSSSRATWSEQFAAMVEKAKQPMIDKRETLMQLYKIETGEDYA